MTSLWRVDPVKLPPKQARTRKIRGGPLIDLAALQQAITDGRLSDDDVWLATKRAEHKVEDLTWSLRDLLGCIGCLAPSDFKGSEWCEDSYGGTHACDAYAICYDDHACVRARNSCCYYLKFSMDDKGGLRLVVISCHV